MRQLQFAMRSPRPRAGLLALGAFQLWPAWGIRLQVGAISLQLFYTASGIPVSADKIVAQPGTLTGSIGVVRKGLNLAPALKKAGVDVDSVTVGKHALIHSSFKSRTRGEARMLDAWTDRIYADLIDMVAEGRGMSHEAVHKVAKGRIWTGQQALGHGLVDQLGGLHDAISLAKQLAELPEAEGAVSLTNWRDGLETADKATCTPTTSSKDCYVSGKQASKDASLELPPMPNTPPTQKTVLAMLSRFQGMFGVAGEVGKEVNPWPASQDDVTDALQYVRINPAHRDRQW